MGCFERLPKVNNCCCCISLAVGARLIAVLCVLYWSSALFSSIFEILSAPQNERELKELSVSLNGKEFSEEELEAYSNSSYIFNSFMFGLRLFGGILAICLTIGAFKTKAKYIKVWLVGELLLMVLYILTQIWMILKVDTKTFAKQRDIIAGLISIVIRGFWWLSLNTYYGQLIQSQTVTSPNETTEQMFIQYIPSGEAKDTTKANKKDFDQASLHFQDQASPPPPYETPRKRIDVSPSSSE